MSRIETIGAFRLNQITESDEGEIKDCAVDGCFESTRGKKTYCTQHIEKQPYVIDLLQLMEGRDAEDLNVEMQGSSVANLAGITTQEILLQLRTNGPRTLERLTRELQIEKSIIYKYAVALNRSGMVVFETTGRGNLSLQLTNQEASEIIDDE